MMITMGTIIQKLFRDDTEKMFIQLFRYTFVGGAAFLVDIGSLYILTSFVGIYYLISAAIAFILGLIVNYLLSIGWVFNNRTLDSAKLEFGVFALIGVVGLGFNEVLIWFFTDYVHIFYLISKMIAAVLILFWNFFARKFTLFK
jgi:putative flippase GtrA